MTLGRTRAVGLRGIVGFLVDVEVDVASGLPLFSVGGCPDGACAQAPDRVKAAAANSGHPIPLRRVIVNLSPASIPKVGSGFDLAICVAALVASEAIPARCRPRGRPHRRARARRDRATGTRRPSARPRRRPEGSTPRRRPGRQRGRGPARPRRPGPPGRHPRRARHPVCRAAPGTHPLAGAGAASRTGRGGTVAGPRRGRRAARGPARPRGRGRGRPSPLPRRATGRREDDARRAAARTAARARRRPGHGGHRHRVGPRAGRLRRRRSSDGPRSSHPTTERHRSR